MKFIIFLCFIFGYSFAQEAYLTSDFYLTNDVIKAETVKYKYNALTKTFEADNTNILEFKKGRIQSKKHIEHNGFGLLYNTDDSYVYNAQNQLVKIESKNKSNYIFSYNTKGNLIEKRLDVSQNPKVITYAYDNQGRLINCIEKDGVYTSSEKKYYDIQSKKDYKYTHKYYKYNSTNLLFTEDIVVKDGLIVMSTRVSEDKKEQTITNFEYDRYGNLLKTKANNGTDYTYIYGYDAKGNVIKMRYKDGVELYSEFTKITYQDGTTSGSTDFAPYFTEGIQFDSDTYANNVNPKSKYKIKKDANAIFTLTYTNGVELKADEVETTKGANKEDLFLYDYKTGESAIIYGLYKPDFPIDKWVEAKPFNSPTGKYIIVNTDWRFFILEKSKIVESTKNSIHAGIDGKSIIIAEDGKEKYFIPTHSNNLKALTIYPLFLISK
ncbi:RHS repeat domain-containing protein [Flavobacterium croceum]|uniref:RHS repeat domain-containing protein n=1 Tax=Flavobacterium croceum TaxID=370975 RepID=UPI0024A819AE|nr:RHS repeat domain-containing protein [Flavobacterium croceum]